MIYLLKKLFKYLVMDTFEAARPFTVGKRYKHFRRTLLLIMTVITMTPLVVAATLSYYQYQVLLEKEFKNHIRWNAESAGRTISAFIEELRSVIGFIADEYSHEDLADQEFLSSLFSRLKHKRGLVDLGYIDPRGIQQTYAGPYEFRGKGYRNMVWLKESIARRSTVSEVFMGYRKMPHFVIALTKKRPGLEEYWVLRASIDAETLGQFIGTIDTEASDDIFLINHAGELQTSSRYFGKVGDTFPLESLPYKSGVTLKVEKGDSFTSLKAFAYIEGTPWILVLVKRGYIHERVWSSFKMELIGIVFISAVLAFIVILRTANILGSRIREADEKREAMLSEVEHTSKLASIGRLAAGVAHEINNPLAIISEKAGLMQDFLEISGDFQYKDNFYGQIGGILDAVNRCKVITHRLLGFARRMDVTPEFILLNEVVREVLSFLDKESLYRGIKFELELQENLPKIQSDKGQLQQILLNIINNAIDALERGGRVVIASCSYGEAFVGVRISDNGPGISEENMKYIFEPFFTTKTHGEHKGTGLGLSITYGLVKKLGGKISVESTLGVGSTFNIMLPIEFKVGLDGEDGSDTGFVGG
ncbi:MAG: two-component sensor histidine kinase [Proteobacteria bacterium]|nr:two-component sensor histidine kinase [Pseudomonadota bacterium]